MIMYPKINMIQIKSSVLARISHRNRREKLWSAVDTRHIGKSTRRHTVRMLRMLLAM